MIYIWSILYDLYYMIYIIWSILYDLYYMIYIIWSILYDLYYMIYIWSIYDLYMIYIIYGYFMIIVCISELSTASGFGEIFKRSTPRWFDSCARRWRIRLHIEGIQQQNSVEHWPFASCWLFYIIKHSSSIPSGKHTKSYWTWPSRNSGFSHGDFP